MRLEDVIRRINSFAVEAPRTLAVHEAAPSRAVLLDDTYAELQKLSLKQDERALEYRVGVGTSA